MSTYNRNLNAEEQKELDEWLKIKRIELNHRTRRDLSDVVRMAQLFKSILFKLVDMKNYTSHGNLAAKILNWETFNLKVLRRTGLHLKRPELEQLASGDLAAIRALLFHLMHLERNGLPTNSSNARSPRKAQSPRDSNPDHEQISLAKYEELKMVNETKAEFINLLKNKVKYLESVTVDKDKRIAQLLSHLSTLTMRIIAMQSQSEELK